MKIYHIVTPTDWQQYSDLPIYEAASLHTEGFIHCSTASQVAGVVERYYSEVPDLLLLHINEQALGEKLVYEASTNQELFPHLYAPLNKEAVVQISKLKSNGLIIELPEV
jgi:uncharacterized protein (DUF952 family)